MEHDSWTCPICQSARAKPVARRGFHFKLLHVRHGSHLDVPPWWRGHEQLQNRVALRMESHALHIAIIVLTAIDLAFVLTGLALAAFHGNELPHHIEEVEDGLAYGSIVILSMFTIEQFFRFAIFGFSYFLNLWHLLDATVIVTSLILEILLRGPARDTAALLIVFRLWRLVRVIHGIGEALTLEHKDVMEKHHKLIRQLQREVLKLARGGGVEYQEFGTAVEAVPFQEGNGTDGNLSADDTRVDVARISRKVEGSKVTPPVV
jgi:voltage-gated hydrogen channel 1